MDKGKSSIWEINSISLRASLLTLTVVCESLSFKLVISLSVGSNLTALKESLSISR